MANGPSNRCSVPLATGDKSKNMVLGHPLGQLSFNEGDNIKQAVEKLEPVRVVGGRTAERTAWWLLITNNTTPVGPAIFLSREGLGRNENILFGQKGIHGCPWSWTMTLHPCYMHPFGNTHNLSPGYEQKPRVGGSLQEAWTICSPRLKHLTEM